MANDLDIYRAAAVLIREHGDDDTGSGMASKLERVRCQVSLWLEADVVRVTPESPLFPRKRTSSAQERFGLKKRTLDVCLTPESGRKWTGRWRSAVDPKRTFMMPPAASRLGWRRPLFQTNDLLAHRPFQRRIGQQTEEIAMRSAYQDLYRSL